MGARRERSSVDSFDLIKAMPSGQVYVVFEKQLRIIDNTNSAIFSTNAITAASLIPDAIATGCYPVGSNLDASAKLYKLQVDGESGNCNYYFVSNHIVRAVQNSVVGQCGFDTSKAILVSNTAALEALARLVLTSALENLSIHWILWYSAP
jgi:hypothetical protein